MNSRRLVAMADPAATLKPHSGQKNSIQGGSKHGTKASQAFPVHCTVWPPVVPSKRLEGTTVGGSSLIEPEEVRD